MKKYRLRSISSLILFSLLITTCFNIPIYARTSVTEHCFGYNHPNFTYSGYYLTELSSFDCATYIHNALDNHGYYNQYVFQNNSAYPVISSIDDDGIFYINAHGSSGIVTCAYYESSQWKLNLLTATNTNNDPLAYSLQAYHGSTTTKLTKVKMAYFSSCNSANTSSSGYGNLLTKATQLGADAAVGFSNTINKDSSEYFDKKVIAYYGMDGNNTLSACIASSKQDTYNQYGGYGGVDSCTIQGSGNIKLVPASYGS